LKSKYFFVALANEIGEKNLSNIIQKYLYENRFKTISLQEFLKYFKHFDINLENDVDNWSNNKRLPGFYFTKMQNYKFIDGERERFQVRLNISNPSQTDGFVKLTFNPRRRGGRSFGRDNSADETIFEESIKIPFGKTVSYSTVLDEEPGSLTINTFLSQNLPLQQEFNFQEFDENKKANAIMEQIIQDEPDIFKLPNEYIVDNEDSSFVIHNPKQNSWLKNVLDMQDSDTTKYIGIRFWNLQEVWRATINSDAYGELIHSAHFAKAGESNAMVDWNINIEKSGYYDVYTYIVKPETRSRRGDNNNRKMEYNYIVNHDDGAEEINLDFNNSTVGWNLLGSFYFSEGEAKVSLTNKAENGIIYADAIKWVARN
jgi:hypothetical protein